ncbi:MAG: DUF2079 domain-containing protein, partial [Chloroflexota bacterium]
MSAHAVERTTISEPQQAPMIQAGAPGQAWKRVRVASATLARSWTAVLLLIGVCAWGALFTNLSVTRHQALGSHAEDLGFTDQVIWNFLRGAWFQMTVYQGASWNIELDMSTVRRPNSLNSFHVEPMLLLFAPVYAAGGRPEHLLAIQAIGVALGAIPAYRLAYHLTELRLAGFAIGAAWLLSPLGQWAVLSDFHTTALAAPLLMFAAERFATGHARTAFVAAILAASAREDAAVAAAALGCVIALSGRWRAGLMLATLGTLGAACALMTMKAYSGGESSPFIVRYGAVLGGPTTMLEALRQPAVTEYLVTLVLSGAWLSVLAPISFAPALPLLAMNVFSNSPWMASGKAHYSILVLPFLVTAAATTLGALTRVCTPPTFRGLHLVPRLASIALLAGAGAGYLQAGSGPFAANASPAVVTSHALTARAVAASIPQRARVSSTASIYPHLSQRASSYVFPAVEDAEYVLLDVAGSPAPTSAGDVFLRVRSMLESGEWTVESARNGVILLQRIDAEPTRAEACAALSCIPMEFYSFTRLGKSTESPPVIQSFIDGQLELLTATIMPSSNGAVEPDGPRGILRTVWQTQSALPEWVWPELTLSLNDGSSLIRDDLAALWWYPPERWQPGELIQLDIPG